MRPCQAPQHQALLGAVVSHYISDARIHAVIMFGSVGRGDWHPNSDLDLDIVIADGLRVDPVPRSVDWRLPLGVSTSVWPC